MSIHVGDKVQIKNGSIDVTTGIAAVKGKMYGEGGPLWATVDLIQSDWNTRGIYGLPPKITKVRCIGPNGVVVWQVQPNDIAPQTISSSQPNTIRIIPQDTPMVLIPTDTGSRDFGSADIPRLTNPITPRPIPVIPTDIHITEPASSPLEATASTTQLGSHSAIGEPQEVVYERINKGNSKVPGYEAADNIRGVGGLVFDNEIMGQKNKTAFSDDRIRRQMLNEDIENIQNPNGFPNKTKNSSDNITAKYDYRIRVGDPKYPMMVTLEDKLRDTRAALGIPVHGRQDLAKAMKYYMYNRFKTPDINMAHNKTFTYVFFTRPDLNLLRYVNGSEGGIATDQVRNHSEASVLYRRNPEIFKLLTNYKRCGDKNNFNLLLSNQVTSFDIQDETLSTIEAGRTWSDYKMIYGDTYDGRSGGEFSCNFNEVNDYSIINMMKLWITYIDNVSKGAWSPSYNLLGGEGVSTSINGSHVYSKTLDYAADAYVFKCGPDGEDVLYWSKYFGIFPTNTGASALSWELNQPVGDTPKLNIRFKYSFKRDMSPISIVEFNANTGITPKTLYEKSFEGNLGHSIRPYVGAPFVDMRMPNPQRFHHGTGVLTGANAPKASIRLKFLPPAGDAEEYRYDDNTKGYQMTTPNELSDNQIYRSNMANINKII